MFAISLPQTLSPRYVLHFSFLSYTGSFEPFYQVSFVPGLLCFLIPECCYVWLLLYYYIIVYFSFICLYLDLYLHEVLRIL